MDEVDRGILYHLDVNSRSHARQIARLIGEKSEKVNYRLRRLFRDRVIRRCYAEFNPWKLGYTSFKVYLQFQGVDKEKIDEMYSFLARTCNVNWAASCLGRWDMVIEILAKDRHEFSRIYSKFHRKYFQYILYKVVGVTLGLTFMNKKWLLAGERQPSVSVMSGQPECMVDSKDIRILKCLTRNCRDSVKDISAGLGMPPTTVSQRISSMVQKGIITNFRTYLDIKRFNRVFCKSFVYFSKGSEEEERALMDYCVRHRDVVFVNKSIAPWDMEIEAHSPSFNKFTEMMNEIRNRFPAVVRNFEAVVINKGTGSFYTLPDTSP